MFDTILLYFTILLHADIKYLCMHHSTNHLLPALTVGWRGKMIGSVCLFVCLTVCLQHNSKTNYPKVSKLGTGNGELNDDDDDELGIS